MSDTKVKVAVRVRPMNRRELELNTKCVVEMEGNQTVLHPPPSNTKQGERYSGRGEGGRRIRPRCLQVSARKMGVLFPIVRRAASSLSHAPV
ncbi:kinesin-like protein KIF13A [Hipposideros larvatus]